MISPAGFRDLISGQRAGLAASLGRRLLRCAEIPYAFVVRVRNARYDRQSARIHKVPVPVISAGNLTLGGTGKTPLVEWLARWYSDRGVRVALVSRGYRATSTKRNDEAQELAEKLPHVPHVQNPDRVSAAWHAIREHQAQLLLLDDGFQHRRLHRDLDIVLLDALEPFGYEHVFPRGMLREPLASLKRAHIVALSRADAVDLEQRRVLRTRVGHYAPEAAWIEVAHGPQSLLAANGERTPVDFLAGRRIAAFCGIGSPAGFRHTLAACGATVVEFREFPDHHPYSESDLAELAGWADAAADVAAVVCTHKDLVKVRRAQLGRAPLLALKIELAVLSGRDLLESALTQFLPHEPLGQLQ